MLPSAKLKGYAVGRFHLPHQNYGTHCQNLPAIMMIWQILRVLQILTYFASISF